MGLLKGVMLTSSVRRLTKIVQGKSNFSCLRDSLPVPHRSISSLYQIRWFSSSKLPLQSYSESIYHINALHPHTISKPLQSIGLSPSNGFFLSCRHMSGNKPVVARLTEEINIEELRQQLRRERKEGNKNVNLPDKIKEAVAKKCEEIVANFTEEEQKQFKVIQLEHNFLYSEGCEILPPEEMTNENWLEAMNQSTKAGRLKYYLFLQKRAHLKASQKEKQKGKTDVATVRPMNIYEHGRIFMRIYESTMRRWQTYRLASSMQFGLPLVFDMDYVNEMKASDTRNTASQLVDVYGYNRQDENMPFSLHFANCPEDNATYKLFQIYMQDTPDVMITVSNQSYLDLFDKKDLIYLSPKGRQVMREFDPNAIYIVGAFNDKASGRPISYARAKEQGIRCQRLPLDEHLNWTQGRKDLTLDQVMRILQAKKNNLPWKDALQFVPKRKVTRHKK